MSLSISYRELRAFLNEVQFKDVNRQIAMGQAIQRRAEARENHLLFHPRSYDADVNKQNFKAAMASADRGKVLVNTGMYRKNFEDALNKRSNTNADTAYNQLKTQPRTITPASSYDPDGKRASWENRHIQNDVNRAAEQYRNSITVPQGK